MQRHPSFTNELADSEGDGLLRQRKSTAAPQQRHPSNHHSTASYSPHSPPTHRQHTTHPSTSVLQNHYSRTDVKRYGPSSPQLPGAPYINGTYSSQASRPASTFYDPTADHRDRRSGWDHAHQSSYSPVQVSLSHAIPSSSPTETDTDISRHRHESQTSLLTINSTAHMNVRLSHQPHPTSVNAPRHTV